jgi:hypothetical protein
VLAAIRHIIDPQLIGAGQDQAADEIEEDRTVVITVSRAYELAQGTHLKSALAEQARNGLVI